ncbi:MAG: toxin secretion, membrane fusion protein [Saprospiraceae bacterium]|nr:toxin secretion, membrane fusion protein [Saprospiraceae bacterium]
MQVFKLGEEPKDVFFWQTQSYAARLAALEEIRQSYISWKYGTEQRFQRVYRVVELS